MCVLSAHLEAHCTLFFIFLFGLSSPIGCEACRAEPIVHFVFPFVIYFYLFRQKKKKKEKKLTWPVYHLFVYLSHAVHELRTQ